MNDESEEEIFISSGYSDYFGNGGSESTDEDYNGDADEVSTASDSDIAYTHLVDDSSEDDEENSLFVDFIPDTLPQREQVATDGYLAQQLQTEIYNRDILNQQRTQSRKSISTGRSRRSSRGSGRSDRRRRYYPSERSPAPFPGRLTMRLANGFGGPRNLLSLLHGDIANIAELFRIPDPPSDGMDPATVALFPTREVGSEDQGKEKRKCAICLFGYEKGNKVMTLPCLHQYHEECIKKWLEAHHLCPICQHNLNNLGVT